MFSIEALSDVIGLFLVAIITGFFPLLAMSFFWFKIGKKQNEYDKVIDTFGISKKRDVRKVFRPINYILPLLFSTLICFVASYAFVNADLVFTGERRDSIFLSGPYFGKMNIPVQMQAFQMLAFAFLGSFLWSAKEIINRLINYDLHPSIFYKTGIRIITASSIVLVFYFMLGSESNTAINFDMALPWLAIATGLFPERVLTFLIDKFKRFVGGQKLNDEILNLTNIEGIGISQKERLAEENIFNAQNLATASLIQLIIRTPYEARQILDWIGQAKLLCYFKGDMEKVRSVGIRTVYDFYRGTKSREALNELAAAAKIATPILEVVSDQVKDDIGIRNLYHFENKLNGDNRMASTTEFEPPVESPIGKA